ncbi:MAG: 4Fe-4S dicluster domain-containing protein [Actinomycetota bacterium]
MKRVYAKEKVCIGCRLCEIWCRTEHSKSKNIIKAHKKEFPRPMARVLVEEAIPVSFAIQCRHCDEPACVESCITGALTKEESGRVAYNEAKCVGCWTCVLVCPYGAPQRDLARKKIAKCDLCPDRLIPACVEMCPNRALVYEER